MKFNAQLTLTMSLFLITTQTHAQAGGVGTHSFIKKILILGLLGAPHGESAPAQLHKSPHLCPFNLDNAIYTGPNPDSVPRPIADDINNPFNSLGVQNAAFALVNFQDNPTNKPWSANA